MINEDSLRRAYNRIKELYSGGNRMQNSNYRMEHNPVKQAFEIAGMDGCVLKSTNVMYATLDGSNITKVISIDDVTGISNETIVYTDKYLNTYIKQNVGLTPLRCGIMATLAADLNCNIISNTNGFNTKVGFIGNGKINQKTMEVLNILFGLDSCVIRGSEKDRAKNKEKFESIVSDVTVDDTDDLSILNQCDIVFCCTSSYRKEDMISKDKLMKPRLLVVQDSGYILDESFRKDFWRNNYTDHEEQLYEHYKDEFPYDRRRRYFPTMHCKTGRSAVYLYGVAIADLIVFEEFFLEDIRC